MNSEIYMPYRNELSSRNSNHKWSFLFFRKARIYKKKLAELESKVHYRIDYELSGKNKNFRISLPGKSRVGFDTWKTNRYIHTKSKR